MEHASNGTLRTKAKPRPIDSNEFAVDKGASLKCALFEDTIAEITVFKDAASKDPTPKGRSAELCICMVHSYSSYVANSRQGKRP